MWDFSGRKAAASKWRRVTAEELARQVTSAAAIRSQTAILKAGGTVPLSRRKRRSASGLPPPIYADEAAELRAFLGLHWGDIRWHLERAASDQDQLQVARAYRDVLVGVPGAIEAWVRLVSQLSL